MVLDHLVYWRTIVLLLYRRSEYKSITKKLFKNAFLSLYIGKFFKQDISLYDASACQSINISTVGFEILLFYFFGHSYLFKIPNLTLIDF